MPRRWCIINPLTTKTLDILSYLDTPRPSYIINYGLEKSNVKIILKNVKILKQCLNIKIMVPNIKIWCKLERFERTNNYEIILPQIVTK